jgi:hypothetical protein
MVLSGLPVIHSSIDCNNIEKSLFCRECQARMRSRVYKCEALTGRDVNLAFADVGNGLHRRLDLLNDVSRDAGILTISPYGMPAHTIQHTHRVSEVATKRGQ